MITITFIRKEPPCDKCKATKEILKSLLEKYHNQITIKDILDTSEEASKYGVFMTPMVIVDKAIIAIGKVPSKERIEKFINTKLKISS